jgi:hypothetical protein
VTFVSQVSPYWSGEMDMGQRVQGMGLMDQERRTRDIGGCRGATSAGRVRLAG